MNISLYDITLPVFKAGTSWQSLLAPVVIAAGFILLVPGGGLEETDLSGSMEF